jgi:uncharacterized protein (TIGR04255 family)
MIDRTGVLKHSPLILAIASVRFASWPLLGKKIDEIHDELRDTTPLIQKIQVQSQVPIAFQGLGGIQAPETQTHWLLLKSNRKTGVLLTPDQVLLISKDYVNFVEFSEILDKVLKALLDRMRFIDVVNVGARYVDMVSMREGEQIENYISGGFIVPNIVPLKRAGGLVFANYQSGDNELRVRCVAQTGLPSVPEDLLGLHFMLQEPNRLVNPKVLESHEFVLDMDAIANYEEPTRMDREELLSKVSSLHDTANEFFRDPAVFTDHAFAIWKGV